MSKAPAASGEGRLIWSSLVASIAVMGCSDGSAPQGQSRVERLGNDILAAGSAVEISTEVGGDAIATGGRIRFDGTAGGDYLGAGGEQAIQGTIGGSVRAAGGEVSLDADVGRNVSIVGGRIELTNGSAVRGNAYLAGAHIQLEGLIEGGARVAGETVTVNGSIGDELSVRTNHLVIGPEARIAGDLRYRAAGDNVTIDPAAEITGEVVALPQPARMGWRWLGILWHVGFLIAAGVVVVVFPGVGRKAARAIHSRLGASIGWGLVWVLAVPIALAVVALTIIGIPLALIVFGLYMISLYLGRLATAVWLGGKLAGNRIADGRAGMVGRFALGGVVLVILGLVPLLGPLVTLVTTVLGLGAIAVALGWDA